jgi:hypothetical protein
MPEELCSERVQLSDVVVKAVQAVYTARHEYDLAVKEKHESGHLTIALAQSRTTESGAVKELNAHRKQHGC